MPTSDLDIFLRLDGIDGESHARGHEKEIAVLSYEQVVDAAVVVSGSRGGAARTNFSGIRFRKNVDAASIPMLLACASGQHISEARFTFRRRASGHKVTLDDVLLTDLELLVRHDAPGQDRQRCGHR